MKKRKGIKGNIYYFMMKEKVLLLSNGKLYLI